MKTAIVTLTLLAALLAVPGAVAGDDPGECNGDLDAACFYDHDDDPATTDQLCLVWAPEIAVNDCLVGG